MGGCYSIDNIDTSNYSNFCPLRIASLYADIDESINKEKKINTLVDYFMKSYYDYNLDIFCIQGIHSYRILKEILSTFRKRIEIHNNENYTRHNGAIYVEYCPNISTENINNCSIWATSEMEDEIRYYDKLIISRHQILQHNDIQIGTERQNKIQTFDSSILRNNMDDDIETIFKYIQVVNINVDGTYISLYNVEIEDDNIGISNIKERKKQLNDLTTIINLNKKFGKEETSRMFVHGDNTFVASYRDIHIVTGMFHINAIKNGIINPEYNKLCSLISGFDIHKWIRTLLKKSNKSLGISNVRYTKDSYTFMISEHLLQQDNISDNSVVLFKNHKSVIISSNITKNHVDMNQFTNYPEDTVIMLYKPNIELYDSKFINNRKQKRYHNVRNSNDTTQFIEQFTNVITTDRYPTQKYSNSSRQSVYSSPIKIEPSLERKTPSRINYFRQNCINSTDLNNNIEKKSDISQYSQKKPIKKNVFLNICSPNKNTSNTIDIELENLSRYDTRTQPVSCINERLSLSSYESSTDENSINTICDNKHDNHNTKTPNNTDNDSKTDIDSKIDIDDIIIDDINIDTNNCIDSNIDNREDVANAKIETIINSVSPHGDNKN